MAVDCSGTIWNCCLKGSFCLRFAGVGCFDCLGFGSSRFFILCQKSLPLRCFRTLTVEMGLGCHRNLKCIVFQDSLDSQTFYQADWVRILRLPWPRAWHRCFSIGFSTFRHTLPRPYRALDCHFHSRAGGNDTSSFQVPLPRTHARRAAWTIFSGWAQIWGD